MQKFKKAITIAVTATAAVAGSVAVSGPASAASTPIGACNADGSSYHVIDHHDLGKAVIYLLYNGSRNCVVTWKDSPDGKYVEAYITRAAPNDPAHVDDGYYSTYAGPVYTSAAGQCIIWAGAYDSTVWSSGSSHCG